MRHPRGGACARSVWSVCVCVPVVRVRAGERERERESEREAGGTSGTHSTPYPWYPGCGTAWHRAALPGGGGMFGACGTCTEYRVPTGLTDGGATERGKTTQDRAASGGVRAYQR